MKINFKNGEVSGLAENERDIRTLCYLAELSDEDKVRVVGGEVDTAVPVQTRQKRQRIVLGPYKKTCDVCGKKYKVVAIHKVRAHSGRFWNKHSPVSSVVTQVPQIPQYNASIQAQKQEQVKVIDFYKLFNSNDR